MRFAKIPNDIFYKKGKLFKDMGGVDSFVLYCFIIHLKNMSDQAYITINEINRVVGVDKNKTRARKQIITMLKLLKHNKLIEVDVDNVKELKNNDFFIIKWIDISKNRGWFAFYATDFYYYKDITKVAYCIMWLIRVYTNKDSGTAFLSIRTMSEILEVGTSTITNGVKELEDLGHIEVIRDGSYHYNSMQDRTMKYNNSYKWRG